MNIKHNGEVAIMAMESRKNVEPSMESEFYFQWHITERCNWRCKHCYHEGYTPDGELTSAQLQDVITKMEHALNAWGKVAAVSITGGEPWIRADDVKGIIDRLEASPFFSRVDLLTNGSMLDDAACNYLASKKILRRVQVSVEGSTPEKNDAIRGEGSFNKIISAIRQLVKHKINVGVMMTIAEYNYDDVINTLEMLSKEGVETFALERFMPTGQSAKQREKTLSAEHVKETFSKLNAWARNNRAPRALQYRPLFCMLEDDIHVGAMCSVGENALTILHDGTILPCRRLPMPLGNILRDNLIQLWAESPVLWQVRRPSGLNAKCGHCPDIAQCRGCRAMALAVTGDWLAADPHCWRTVDKTDYIGPRLKNTVRLVWPQHTDIHFAYSTSTGESLELEEPVFIALQLMDGYHLIKDVALKLQNASGCTREEAESGIKEIVQQLDEMGFIEH